MKSKTNIYVSILFDVLIFSSAVVMIHLIVSKSSPWYYGTIGFKFYTNLSNMFLGVVSLFKLVIDILRLSNRGENAYPTAYFLKYIACITTTITFLIAIFFIGPLKGYKEAAFDSLPNIFFHSIVPVLGLVSLLVIDKPIFININLTSICFIPTLIYSAFYITNYQKNRNEDIYSLFQNGLGLSVLLGIGFFLLNISLGILFRYIINSRVEKLSENTTTKVISRKRYQSI